VNVLPARALAILALSNSSPVGAPEAVCRSFLDLVTRGRIERDWLTLFGGVFEKMDAPAYGQGADYSAPPPAAAPVGPLRDYDGTYVNDLYGPLVVTQDVSGLSLRMGPENTNYVMHHYSGDVFTFQPRGENAFGPSPMRFMHDGKGKAASVRIDYFDETGQGLFTRA
jgi:Domain of unknown function (DUF3471)